MKKNNKVQKFPGFPDPYQSWDFPVILNGYIHLLTGAEFKVLWYILRHTYGWQKDKDEISLTQLEKGIKRKRDGTWLDRGTGLSRQGIIEAISGKKNNKGKCLGLIKKGFIEKSKGKRANCFRPKVVNKIDYPSQRSRPIGSQKNRHTITNITISNNTTNDVVFNKLIEIGISSKKAKEILKSPDLVKINRILEEIEKNPRIKNKAGWFLTALKENWNLEERFYICEYGYKHPQGEECGHREEAKYKKLTNPPKEKR